MNLGWFDLQRDVSEATNTADVVVLHLPVSDDRFAVDASDLLLCEAQRIQDDGRIRQRGGIHLRAIDAELFIALPGDDTDVRDVIEARHGQSFANVFEARCVYMFTHSCFSF